MINVFIYWLNFFKYYLFIYWNFLNSSNKWHNNNNNNNNNNNKPNLG